MRFSLILFFCFLAISACTVDGVDSNSSICPATPCNPVSKIFKVKFLDKDKGTDLLFGASARLGLREVTIYSKRYKKNIEFNVDSINNSDKYLVFSTTGTDEFLIRTSSYSTSEDSLMVETKFVDSGCCGYLDITKLTLNNTSLSFSNSAPPIIILRK